MDAIHVFRREAKKTTGSADTFRPTEIFLITRFVMMRCAVVRSMITIVAFRFLLLAQKLKVCIRQAERIVRELLNIAVQIECQT